MMNMISVIRQMMADAKFFEAQKAIESILVSADLNLKKQMAPLFLEVLIAQNKNLPIEMLLEVAEMSCSESIDKAISWFKHINPLEAKRHLTKYLKIKMIIDESQGRIDELYTSLSSLQIYLFTSKIPSTPIFVSDYTKKYFQHDFNLKLQQLSLELLRGDIKGSEESTRSLIMSCFEQSSPKKINIKLGLIRDVLNLNTLSSGLDVYKNLCDIYNKKVTSRNDYKKLAEMIIFFDDYKFQVIVLNLLLELDFLDIADDYARSVKENDEYDFVYLDKFFKGLKYLFVSVEDKAPEILTASLLTDEDLILKGGKPKQNPEKSYSVEHLDEEVHFINILTYQEYSFSELLEISTSFLQARMPKVAMKASELALEKCSGLEEYLKGAYLKLMSLLQLRDYRAALDLSIEATGKSVKPEDQLSFLYVQAELFMKLGEKEAAKDILESIYAVDENYRLTRERLVKLDEI